VIGSGEIEIRRRLPAPIAEVFRWWTDPELLREWMSPMGSVDAEVDLRVGGALRIVMKGAGVLIEHVGEFVEIEPPRRLVFTWKSEYTGGQPSLVTLELEPEGDRVTRLRLVHAQLPETAADSHRGGWGAMIDRLAGKLTREVNVGGAG
jgi:uncharacterized protein YndB with AHSA1/START domain